MTMRPRSIIWFERVMLLGFALSVVSLAVTWRRMIALMPAELHSPGPTLITLTLIIFAPLLLLLWFVSRKRSVIAKWIFVVFYGSSLLFAVYRPARAIHWGPISAALTVAQYVGIAISLWLLFRPDARKWFRGEGPVDPDVFS